MITMPSPAAKRAVPWSRIRQMSTASMETEEVTARKLYLPCAISLVNIAAKHVPLICHQLIPFTTYLTSRVIQACPRLQQTLQQIQ